jgi:hypothetical protein
MWVSMHTFKGWLGLATLLASLCLRGSAQGAIIEYFGIDSGVGPGQARPNSDAQAALYAARASFFGPTQKVDFEGLPLGQPSTDNTPITVAQNALYGNVTLSVTGMDHTVVSGFPFGISNRSGDPVNDGYNTTLGGSQFYWFVPSTAATTAIATFSWQLPAQTFGAYITGLGTAQGSLNLVFNDGSPQSLAVTGSASGGVEFFGFTDYGHKFNSISFILTNYSPTNRDTFGIDDILIGYIPEPASGILLLLSTAIGGMALRLARLKAARHQGV